MKNLLVVFALVLGSLSFSYAQSDSNAPVTVNMEAIEMAEKAALADDSIERKVCSQSGKVSYYKNTTCPASGKVTSQRVHWDEAKATFVSAKMEAGASTKTCTKAAKKECSANAVKTSTSKKQCAKKCKKTCSKKSASSMKAEAKSDVETLKSSSNI